MSFKLFQSSSSRLTLVLWPVMTIERFESEDFTASLPRRDEIEERHERPDERLHRDVIRKTPRQEIVGRVKRI